jgi:KDEL-tailed cysteine endopeptidase
MKTTFATAALLGFVAAGPLGTRPKHGNAPGNNGLNARFGNYGSQFNKHYTDAADYETRMGIFNKNVEEIDRVNSKAVGVDDLRLGVNMFTDMTSDEFSNWTGLRIDPNANTQGFGKRKHGLGDGRRLGHAATTVDHVKDGFMHPVKNQGGCGSCWAFGANTVLEGTIAKKTNSAPVRISEQHLVDCSLSSSTKAQELFGKTYSNGGCNGGWMATAWRMQEEQGYMLDSDYPYVSGTSRDETECAHDANKVVGKVTGYNRIWDVPTMKSTLAKQPLSIAIDAGQAAFQSYKSGVVKMSDNCGNQLNHAVVVVGYSEKDDSVDPPAPPVDVECDVTKWWHTCEPVERRLQADVEGLSNYWKIQNSWGSWWGDEGFIRIDIEEDGDGVCGMYRYVETIERQGGY